MSLEDTKFGADIPPFITRAARELRHEFEQGVSAVFLARAKLRVSINGAYSDSYTDYHIGFWHDEAITPGKTTMPFPDYLIKRWQMYGRFHGQVQDFWSENEKKLVRLSAKVMSEDDVAVCTVCASTSTIQTSIQKLDILASRSDIPPADLFWGGILALSKLDSWKQLPADRGAGHATFRLQVAIDDASHVEVHSILTRDLRQ
ncbi:hypothetical protein GCM10022280_22180 [Sphingomonas swuensis]|uniref:Uncharacterized protein n=1 Tax=Sphingomonas swuensis TaxID=977800 RepID=A0ABP7T538_9SPHN